MIVKPDRLIDRLIGPLIPLISIKCDEFNILLGYLLRKKRTCLIVCMMYHFNIYFFLYRRHSWCQETGQLNFIASLIVVLLKSARRRRTSQCDDSKMTMSKHTHSRQETQCLACRFLRVFYTNVLVFTNTISIRIDQLCLIIGKWKKTWAIKPLWLNSP